MTLQYKVVVERFAMPGRDLFALPIVALDNFGTHHCVMTAGNGVSKEH